MRTLRTMIAGLLVSMLGACAAPPTTPAEAAVKRPVFQLYEGARRPAAEVAILRAVGAQTHVETVSGQGVVWKGARLESFLGSAMSVMGPRLGADVESLELAPGDYNVRVLFYRPNVWSLTARSARLRAQGGRAYTVEARQEGSGRQAKIVVIMTDATTGESTQH